MINFKSLGETDNEIIVEPRITTIIGKNESGKSNVLEGLSHIHFTGNMNTGFIMENINRNNGNSATIEYQITLSPTLQEGNVKDITSATQIIISKDRYLATGGILEFYNINIREYINILIGELGENPLKLNGQNYINYNKKISYLKQEESLNIRGINNTLNYLEEHKTKIRLDERGGIDDSISEVKRKWDDLLLMLPNVFYRNTDKVLKTLYKLDEVQKELKNPNSYPNSLLSDFLELINIPNEDFIFAVRSSSDRGQKTSIRSRINRNVDRMINDEFKKFYTTEHIYLNVEFDANTVSFIAQSNEGETLLLSERSNGLRWYLNTFIDAKAHGVLQSNVIYLFDEPGISLHVNAQKELLNLFEDLADKGNQIVYTTHSPYMLNIKEDGIHRIRAVDKDSEGYTHIYKTAYDSRLSPQNQQDTLAPIVSAIGMTLKDTFGPAKDKLNIVTEGVSDYIYLQTMAKIIKIDMNKINIIPSFGVSNCLNICNILYGWNCPFIAIFDYDKEGVECGGEKMRKNLLYKMGKQYIYLKDIDQKLVESKDYDQSSYMIEDLVGRDILKDFISQKGLSKDASIKNKTLLSKLFCNALEDGTYNITVKSKNRFINLFDRILNAK